METRAILFDMDGTLLPMDTELFTRMYFKILTAKFAPFGYDPKALIDAVWAGTAAMVKNDGAQTNETVFWARFGALMGEGALRDRALFDEFYCKDFNNARTSCGHEPGLPALRHARAAALGGAGSRRVRARHKL